MIYDFVSSLVHISSSSLTNVSLCLCGDNFILRSWRSLVLNACHISSMSFQGTGVYADALKIVESARERKRENVYEVNSNREKI